MFFFLVLYQRTNRSTRSSVMALVLSTWLGPNMRVKPSMTCLQVYTKLGGKHLGKVELRKANKAIVEQVKDLQAQVAKLLRPPYADQRLFVA